MTTPIYPNLISLLDIATEFGRPSTQIGLADYYAGGSLVPAGSIGYPLGAEGAIPLSGQTSLGRFHGATKGILIQINSSGIWTVPAGVTKIRVLVVAGGGAGGGGGGDALEGGGGGGAGGVVDTSDFLVSAGQDYYITIGAGGSRYAPNVPIGDAQGLDSSFRRAGLLTGFGSTIVATGGGRGGHSYGYGYTPPTYNPETGQETSPGYYGNVFLQPAGDGGSGGGRVPYYGGGTAGTGISGQGYDGGPGAENWNSGGGGGAGGPGGAVNGGAVGAYVFGTRLFILAGGGGGGSRDTGGAANGGGGAGGSGEGAWGYGGTANTGGGGGGGAWHGYGGSGGSGVVYIYIG